MAEQGKPNAPGIHVKNKCLLLFKDGGTRQWQQRPRMRGKVGFGQLLNILSDNYMKVLSRRRHAHSRKGSVTAVWTECAKVALDICQPTERDSEQPQDCHRSRRMQFLLVFSILSRKPAFHRSQVAGFSGECRSDSQEVQNIAELVRSKQSQFSAFPIPGEVRDLIFLPPAEDEGSEWESDSPEWSEQNDEGYLQPFMDALCRQPDLDAMALPFVTFRNGSGSCTLSKHVPLASHQLCKPNCPFDKFFKNFGWR